MDSNRLKYFLVVVRTESIRKAAEVLHISPGALSKAIKQLEHETGSTLLTPAGRGIRITQEGKELAHMAEPLIAHLDRLKQDLKDKKNTQRHHVKPIKIASFESFTTHFLSSLVEALPKNHELILQEAIPGQIEKNLLANQVDYGITFLPIPMTGIEHIKVTDIKLAIYGRLDIYEKIPFEELPFATPIDSIFDSPTDIKELDGWPNDNFKRLVKYRVVLMESALELCRKGKAVAYLPSFVIQLHNASFLPTYHLHQIRMPKNMKPQSFTIYLVKRKADPKDAVTNAIMQMINTICK